MNHPRRQLARRAHESAAGFPLSKRGAVLGKPIQRSSINSFVSDTARSVEARSSNPIQRRQAPHPRGEHQPTRGLWHELEAHDRDVAPMGASRPVRQAWGDHLNGSPTEWRAVVERRGEMLALANN